MLVGAVVWAATFAFVAARLAVLRFRNPLTWAAYGAVLGPVALALLVAAPPGRCGICLADVAGWHFRCLVCGSDVRSVPTVRSTLNGRRTASVGRSNLVKAASPTPTETPVADAKARSERSTAGMATRRRATSASWAQRTTGSTRKRGSSTTRSKPAPASAPEPADAQASRAAIATAASEQQRIPEAHDPNEVRILASGVFVGGRPALAIGGRYLVCIRDEAFELRGPVDTSPNKVAFAYDLRDIQAVGVADRFLVTSGDGARDDVALGFVAIMGPSVEALETALAREREALAGASGAARRGAKRT